MIYRLFNAILYLLKKKKNNRFKGFTGDLHCIAILCAIAPAVLLLCFPFAPESPVWLLTQGKCEEAESSLQRLRGNKYNIQNEINQLQMSIASQGERAGIVELRYYKKAIVITICKFCCIYKTASFNLFHLLNKQSL